MSKTADIDDDTDDKTDPLVTVFRLCTKATDLIDPDETPRLHEALHELLRELGMEMGRRLNARRH